MQDYPSVVHILFEESQANKSVQCPKSDKLCRCEKPGLTCDQAFDDTQHLCVKERSRSSSKKCNDKISGLFNKLRNLYELSAKATKARILQEAIDRQIQSEEREKEINEIASSLFADLMPD